MKRNREKDRTGFGAASPNPVTYSPATGAGSSAWATATENPPLTPSSPNRMSSPLTGSISNDDSTVFSLVRRKGGELMRRQLLSAFRQEFLTTDVMDRSDDMSAVLEGIEALIISVETDDTGSFPNAPAGTPWLEPPRRGEVAGAPLAAKPKVCRNVGCNTEVVPASPTQSSSFHEPAPPGTLTGTPSSGELFIRSEGCQGCAQVDQLRKQIDALKKELQNSKRRSEREPGTPGAPSSSGPTPNPPLSRNSSTASMSGNSGTTITLTSMAFGGQPTKATGPSTPLVGKLPHLASPPHSAPSTEHRNAKTGGEGSNSMVSRETMQNEIKAAVRQTELSTKKVVGNVKAQLSKAQQLLRELRQKLNAIRTGVKSYQFPVVLQQFASLVIPQCQGVVAASKRLTDRNYAMEQLVLDTHCRVGTLPDEGSVEGYLPDSEPLHPTSLCLILDDRRFEEWCNRIRSALATKIAKVQQFVTKVVLTKNHFNETSSELRKGAAFLEDRCGNLECLVGRWECLALLLAGEVVFDSSLIQPARKLVYAAAEKQVIESNEEARAAQNAKNWPTKPKLKVKVNGIRLKRTEALQRVEQVLGQELQVGGQGGARNQLRGKIAVLREVITLCSEFQLIPNSGTGSNGGQPTNLNSALNQSVTVSVFGLGASAPQGSGAGTGSNSSSQPVLDLSVSGASTKAVFVGGEPSTAPPASGASSSDGASTPPSASIQSQPAANGAAANPNPNSSSNPRQQAARRGNSRASSTSSTSRLPPVHGRTESSGSTAGS